MFISISWLHFNINFKVENEFRISLHLTIIKKAYISLLRTSFKTIDMGGKSSTEDKKENESSGNCNNNIIVKDTVNVYSVELIVIGGLLLLAQVLQLVLYIYYKHHRKLKNKYLQKGADSA